MRELSTARLAARMPRDGDAEALGAIYRTPQAARWLAGGEIPSPSDMTDMVERDLGYWRQNGFGRWYWIERATGELIARCGPGLFVIEGTPEIEMHWSVRPDRQGRGIATEAAIAATEVTLADRDDVVAFAHVDNVASQAVARRAGYAREREFDFDGQPCVLFRSYSSASASRNASSSGSSIE